MTPSSIAACMTRMAAASSCDAAKPMCQPPRHSTETSAPVRPSGRCGRPDAEARAESGAAAPSAAAPLATSPTNSRRENSRPGPESSCLPLMAPSLSPWPIECTTNCVRRVTAGSPSAVGDVSLRLREAELSSEGMATSRGSVLTPTGWHGILCERCRGARLWRMDGTQAVRSAREASRGPYSGQRR